MAAPLHVTTANRIESEIRSGVWAPGGRLSPERELSRTLDVSRSTLRLALEDLEHRGLITRHQGRGTFVARPQIEDGPVARVGRLNLSTLESRTILITGSTGIAAAAAERFAADGARIFVASRTEANCAGLAERLRDTGAQADHLAADLTDEAQAQRAVDACRATFGRIDGLLAVAGGSGRRFGDGPLHTISGQTWDATVALNARSQALVLGAVLRVMLEQAPDTRGRRGAVVLVTSVLASDPVPVLFATHAYAASKGAIDALVRTTASYYAPWGIRVNGLAPALTDTPMAARAAADPATVAFAARKQPLAGGFVAAGDVATAARFLLSDEAAMMTGQRLVVDGGWSVTAAEPGATTPPAG